ncbi:MAG: SAM-dependent DNA methyltransferase [Lentisphaeria bacterium]|nr:SAM-dependent DNA methyltransferase [Lentisphaeria bacterium]
MRNFGRLSAARDILDRPLGQAPLLILHWTGILTGYLIARIQKLQHDLLSVCSTAILHVDAVEKRQKVDKFCRPVQSEEIEGNGYDLNITRYVDTFEEEEEVDIEANLREVAEVDAEPDMVEAEMAKHLAELDIITETTE